MVDGTTIRVGNNNNNALCMCMFVGLFNTVQCTCFVIVFTVMIHK